jgi:hypothetical protein
MAQDFEVQELRNRINTLEGQVDFLYKHFAITYVPKPDVDDPRIVGFIQKGKMSDAIQIYRGLFPNSDLVDAKRAVEEIKLRHGY